jgi:hypothetical protein
MVTVRITDIEWDDGNLQKCHQHVVSISEMRLFLPVKQ